MLFIADFICFAVAGSEENSSDEDLAEILAALSSMAHKGDQTAAQPASVTRDDLSLVGLRQSSSARATPTRSSRTLREKRKRMVRSRAVCDDSVVPRTQTDRVSVRKEKCHKEAEILHNPIIIHYKINH